MCIFRNYLDYCILGLTVVQVAGEDPQDKFPFWGCIVSGGHPTRWLSNRHNGPMPEALPSLWEFAIIKRSGYSSLVAKTWVKALGQTILWGSIIWKTALRSPKRQKANATALHLRVSRWVGQRVRLLSSGYCVVIVTVIITLFMLVMWY